ncbi:hypothetical protein BJ508DRAFT_335604 [Ascobolus immersus RN42]|uniref:F-box domain-containing protein n=1 Tax=Ascobolus immersus RN42 TaxID=1160509 RepID=A0A3N4HBS1_ASCIM|nr:hypothetical protein BJ508DRAFT_335604 [Ascobolus immersus RN42]
MSTCQNHESENRHQDKVCSPPLLLNLPVELIQTIFSHIDSPFTYLALYTVSSRVHEIASDPKTRHFFAKTWFAAHCNDDEAHAPKLYEYIARYLRRHCNTSRCQTKNTSARFHIMFKKDRDRKRAEASGFRRDVFRCPSWWFDTDYESDDEDEDVNSMLPKCTLPESFTWTWSLKEELHFLLHQQPSRTWARYGWAELGVDFLDELTKRGHGSPRF